MYFGIESRPPLVENDILNYALKKVLKKMISNPKIKTIIL